MPEKITKPSIIKAAGNKTKVIEEFIGRINSNTNEVSIARMISPEGWAQPGQTPEFNEYTIVLSGVLSVKTRDDVFEVNAGEAFNVFAGEWVQYSTPNPEGAEYIAVCCPGFSSNMVYRDE